MYYEIPEDMSIIIIVYTGASLSWLCRRIGACELRAAGRPAGRAGLAGARQFATVNN